MNIKILVYDNQVGYFELLSSSFPGYAFALYKPGKNKRYDAIVFFLHDEIELLDMVRLYTGDIPFILASANTKAGSKNMKNLYTVDAGHTRDVLIANFEVLLQNIAIQINLKEEAL